MYRRQEFGWRKPRRGEKTLVMREGKGNSRHPDKKGNFARLAPCSAVNKGGNSQKREKPLCSAAGKGKLQVEGEKQGLEAKKRAESG